MIIHWKATTSAGLMLALASLAGCGTDQSPTEPSANPSFTKESSPGLAAVVRQLAAARGVGGLERPAPVREELVELGQGQKWPRSSSSDRPRPWECFP